MSIKKRKGFNIGLMLAKLSTERTLNPDKSISMQNFDVVDKYVSFFTTSIVAEGKSDAFVRNVVKDAMNAEQDLTEGKFIKQFIPELNMLSSKEVHLPTTDLLTSFSYPSPILDLKSSRLRAIEVFKENNATRDA